MNVHPLMASLLQRAGGMNETLDDLPPSPHPVRPLGPTETVDDPPPTPRSPAGPTATVDDPPLAPRGRDTVPDLPVSPPRPAAAPVLTVDDRPPAPLARGPVVYPAPSSRSAPSQQRTAESNPRTDNPSERPASRPDGTLDPSRRSLAHAADPTTIGRYTILRRLGTGAMGVVYAAFDQELDRKVAIKVVKPRTRPNPDQDLRVLREAQALAKLSHPNVVQIYEVGELHGQTFLAMEFVQGKTLKDWLIEPPRTWQEIVKIIADAGRGLAAAHAAGLIHRDFKPKSRRPSQTAPQPTDRPHSHSQGRFERVDVYRAAPGRSGVPQVLAKRWQRTGPPEDRRGLAPRHSQGRHHEPFPSHPFATAAPRAAAGR